MYSVANPKQLGLCSTLNLNGYPNYIICLKDTAIFLKGQILPVDGVSSGRLCGQWGYPVLFTVGTPYSQT